jgi:hypothetical protein
MQESNIKRSARAPSQAGWCVSAPIHCAAENAARENPRRCLSEKDLPNFVYSVPTKKVSFFYSSLCFNYDFNFYNNALFIFWFIIVPWCYKLFQIFKFKSTL